jgi:hypothetical protein
VEGLVACRRVEGDVMMCRIVPMIFEIATEAHVWPY